MKIGIEAQRLFRSNKHGMDVAVLELIRQLQQIDTQHEYLIFVRPGPDHGGIKTTRNFQIIELRAPCFPVWEQIILPRAVKKYQCDLLHCTSHTAPLNLRVPLITTVHDIIYLAKLKLLYQGGTGYQKAGNIYRRWLMPFVLKKSSKIIAVSNYVGQQIQAYNPLLAPRLTTIYNGVGAHFRIISHSETLENARKKYQLPEKFLLFLGNTAPKKNTVNVIKAFDQYLKTYGDTQIKLVITDYKEQYLHKTLKALHLSSIKDHIVLTGYVPNEDLPFLYNTAELFLYPSLEEGFGIPMLEAMACQCPIIAGNTSSMPEIAENAAMFVNSYDPMKIAEAIRQILCEEALSTALRKKGLERVKHFSWTAMARDVQAVYTEFFDMC
jgi:glycosyltransferase involved in cell wall biosynthesis